MYAQNNLGLCYYYGRGVTQNYYEAVKWYRKAAEQGHSIAQYGLGTCYYSGKGVPKDKLAATKWFKKAAAQGSPQAKSMLKKLKKFIDKV